jgi:hypothetical protein
MLFNEIIAENSQNHTKPINKPVYKRKRYWYHSFACIPILSGCLCHHNIRCVADGEDGLQIWRVPAKTLNKQSRTADRRWSSSLGVGRGNKPAVKKKSACYEIFNSASDLDGFFGTVQYEDRWRPLVNTVMNIRVLAPLSYLFTCIPIAEHTLFCHSLGL